MRRNFGTWKHIRVRQVGLSALAATATLLGTSAAQAQIDCNSNGTGVEGNITIEGGQVNMAGATLFVDFFRQPSSTNDWIDVDNDRFFGFVNPDPTFMFTDQLSTAYAPASPLSTWWAFNYRSVGSVNGFSEFIDSQLCGTLTYEPPSEAGIFNRFEYALNGITTITGINSTGTPLEQCSIDGAFLDVPGKWAVVAGGTPKWNRNPTAPGYGLNFLESSTGNVSQLQELSRDCSVETLNFDTANPDENTLFDYVAAWVPVTAISNRGTGIENIKFSELQYLFATGRMPTGENIIAVTRDVGSGTHNAFMNSINVDPSWGRGDNIGDKTDNSQTDLVGPIHQPSNKGGSSRVEGTVQNTRLGLGYTGLAGGSRSARDAFRGFYEVVNTCKDVDANGDPLCDCAVDGYVRPNIDTTLDNCDACTGYQIAGSGSFVVRGNIDANRDLGDPNFSTNGPPVANQAVADYLNNIFDSVAVFEGDVFGGECQTPAGDSVLDSLSCSAAVCSNDNNVTCTNDSDCGAGNSCDVLDCTTNADCLGASGVCSEVRTCSSNNDCESGEFCGQIVNSPGQGLAVSFFLGNAIDCVHDLTSPLDYNPSTLNQPLQDYTRANNGLGWGGDTPAYGSITVAGLVPSRLVVSGMPYSDGQSAPYIYWNGASYVTIAAGSDISARNRVAGDFNEDFARDINDATEMVNAYYAPRAWQQTAAAIGAGATGDMAADNAIPEVLGDFDADGHFSKEDLRYFADGLAMSGGSLNRKAGAIAIDARIAALAQDYPWADTNGLLISAPAAPFGEPVHAVPASIANYLGNTGNAYKNGDFRGDIAGASLEVQGRRPNAGGKPAGWDGKIDAADIDYVCAQSQYDWSNIDEAVFMDLSADMDGDLDVDADDVTELVEVILVTNFGDANLDGAIDAADLAIVDNTIDNDPTGCNANQNCGWADGDFTCDGVVDGTDRTLAGGTGGDDLQFISVVSTGNHNANGSFLGGDLDIPMDAADGAAVADHTEPRQFAASGNLSIRVDFAEAIASGSVVSNPALGSLTATANGNSLDITFDAPANGTCYTFDITGTQATGGTTIGAGSADADFCVCYFEGDINFDASVDLLDRGVIALPANLFNTMDVAGVTGPQVDLNRDGSIDLLDRGVIALPANLFADWSASTCP
ncbi:MAG: hypothetical protein R3E58_18810 [Phycisphaerae bacterium]